MDQFVRSDDDGARGADKNPVRRSGHLPFRLTAASAVHLSVTTLLQDAVQGDEVEHLAPAGDGREARERKCWLVRHHFAEAFPLSSRLYY
jgi:hypothetical protein